MEIHEGYIPFMGYKTYYRAVGKCEGNKKPLILLHGGPGSTHNTLEVLDCLANDGRMLIYYDQLGCGLSSIEGSHKELWNKETWVKELDNLREYLHLDEVHLLGHSWGGMLEITYISDTDHKGVKSVVLSSTLPSSSLWAKEQHRLIKFMPLEDQRAIEEAERTNTWTSPEYIKANEDFMHMFVNNIKYTGESPECLRRPKVFGREAYETAWGPNEFCPLGNLKDWEYLDKMKSWDIPTLITDGGEDESTPFINMQMHNAVKGSKWVIFQYSQHMSYTQEHEKYVNLVKEFLNQHD